MWEKTYWLSWISAAQNEVLSIFKSSFFYWAVLTVVIYNFSHLSLEALFFFFCGQQVKEYIDFA